MRGTSWPIALMGLVLGLMLVATGRADPPGEKSAGQSKPLDPAVALGALGGGNSIDSLTGSLRGVLLEALPDPLYEDHRHWGMKEKGPLGKLKNDGQWWKVAIRPRNPRDTLVVDLRDLQSADGGRTLFTVFVSFDATVELDRQHWCLGARLFSGSTRARVRLRLAMRCESTLRMEGKTFLPEAVFRLRVLDSHLGYDNLVVEHTAGVGGEAAKVLGDAMIGGMRQWKPSLERNLVLKCNEAVVKSGDTKEVRLGLSQMLGGKK